MHGGIHEVVIADIVTSYSHSKESAWRVRLDGWGMGVKEEMLHKQTISDIKASNHVKLKPI